MKKMKFKTKLGITNKTADDYFVVFLDIDGIDGIKANTKYVFEELKELQKKYFLSDFYVVKTRHGYHAICLDKFSCNRFIYALYGTFPYGCKQHRAIGLKRGRYTLAFDCDNKKYRVIKSVFGCMIRQKSNAHRILLNSIYGFNIEKDAFFDDLTYLDFEAFNKKEE